MRCEGRPSARRSSTRRTCASLAIMTVAQLCEVTMFSGCTLLLDTFPGLVSVANEIGRRIDLTPINGLDRRQLLGWLAEIL